ncbi:centrosomal protein kizuna isoform X2 [Cuculus canorus]|uniref:centrosomal protein kizuna isoform X2 n=1 Tax=Cuculus canorus TaxID=55661 RepID=UPI0023AAAA26|nr:centrosomal protein kizuna isoform X2 [Cuculus canorus]
MGTTQEHPQASCGHTRYHMGISTYLTGDAGITQELPGVLRAPWASHGHPRLHRSTAGYHVGTSRHYTDTSHHTGISRQYMGTPGHHRSTPGHRTGAPGITQEPQVSHRHSRASRGHPGHHTGTFGYHKGTPSHRTVPQVSHKSSQASQGYHHASQGRPGYPTAPPRHGALPQLSHTRSQSPRGPSEPPAQEPSTARRGAGAAPSRLRARFRGGAAALHGGSRCSGHGRKQSGMSGPGSPGPGRLLRRLRDGEAKRLELERKLMEYRKPDAYLVQLKHEKLTKYLKEVDERQKRSILRNQTLLREFDQLEACMKTSSSELIQKMAWYRREIQRVLSLQEGDLTAESDKEEENSEQTPCIGRQARISTGAAMPRELYHPATDWCVAAHKDISAAGGLGVRQKVPQATESHSASDLPSCSPSLEGLGLESRSTDLESDASVEVAAKCGDLAGSEEDSEQLISSAPDPEPAAAEEEQPQKRVPGPKPPMRNRQTCKEVSQESSVELPVPASAKEMMLNTPSVPQGTASPGDSWEQDRDAHTAERSPLQPPDPPTMQEKPSVSSAPDMQCGMLAGLPRALQLIEDSVVRRIPQHRMLYQGEHVGTMGSAELLSFYNQAGSMKEDDLGACEAVVLHHLRALLQSMLNGCLLPEKTLNAKGRAVDEKQNRPDQQSDVDMLWTYLSNHALFLKKHRVRLTEEVAEMFERLLISGKTVQDVQALPVLKEVLPEECGDRSSIQSNEPSYSSPSIPNDSREIKQAKHVPQLTDAGEEGWDSSDNSSEEKASREIHSETNFPLNERSLPFSRTGTRKATVAAIKSKAFWGESDDSSSEIEAALLPQTHSTEADDFDDFYD